MTQGLALHELQQGRYYYARAGYGVAFHNVVRDGMLLITKCGKWINVATKPLVVIEHPPYAYPVCRKCEKR